MGSSLSGEGDPRKQAARPASVRQPTDRACQLLPDQASGDRLEDLRSLLYHES